MRLVGILGGGQLARMLALAGHSLGLRVRVFDPAPDAAAAVVAEHVCAPWDDDAAIARFCEGLEVATLEFESVPLATALAVAAKVRLAPSVQALAATQDRLAEKKLALDLGIPATPFASIECIDDLERAAQQIGFPAVLKHRTLGYDGRGQTVVRSTDEARSAWCKGGGRPALLEELVNFDRELSLVAARSSRGKTAFYPLVENLHRDGVLRRTIAPAPTVSNAVAEAATRSTALLLAHLDYIGVITLEFFERDGLLLLNEIAPRVHNSGHWSIEGSETSQFENHLRAILDLPLGSTKLVGFSALVNIIGTLPDTEPILRLPDTHLHLYGKAPREGRKLGHVTARAPDALLLEERMRTLQQLPGR